MVHDLNPLFGLPTAAPFQVSPGHDAGPFTVVLRAYTARITGQGCHHLAPHGPPDIIIDN
jgi:hypothetical protein